jgi:hypothetical protein
MLVSPANAVPRAVWALKAALFGRMMVPDHDLWLVWCIQVYYLGVCAAVGATHY